MMLSACSNLVVCGLLVTLAFLSTCVEYSVAFKGEEYGVDVSFPMQHEEVISAGLGDKQTFHNELLQRCVDFYGEDGEDCITNERKRIDMNLRQPQSMKNYTEIGFKKIRAPDQVWKLLKEFWDRNKDNEGKEDWEVGEIFVNHWDVYPSVVYLGDDDLEGGGDDLKQHIWNAARNTISEWTGQALAECSLYGVRVYKEGAVLATHVDRLPLVSSAIINVAQDVDEPWPLEVIGHDGKAHNVTMEPGDMVLYESHSILHGRPFPLKGRYMANVFIHFEPIGPIDGDLEYGKSYLPPYLIPGSPEEEEWRNNNPEGHVIESSEYAAAATEAHNYAMDGALDSLKDTVRCNAKLVNARDVNGWTPLHEATRAGYLDVVEFLVANGSDPKIRTRLGLDALDIARTTLEQDHPVTKFLLSSPAPTCE